MNGCEEKCYDDKYGIYERQQIHGPKTSQRNTSACLIPHNIPLNNVSSDQSVDSNQSILYYPYLAYHQQHHTLQLNVWLAVCLRLFNCEPILVLPTTQHHNHHHRGKATWWLISERSASAATKNYVNGHTLIELMITRPYHNYWTVVDCWEDSVHLHASERRRTCQQ